jgi:hypothetical protein
VQLRSESPVKIHHWDDEIFEENLNDLGSIHQAVSFNDLSKAHSILHINEDGLLSKFQLKAAVLVNSGCAEPLLLDWDNIPCSTQHTLYDSRVSRKSADVMPPCRLHADAPSPPA